MIEEKAASRPTFKIAMGLFTLVGFVQLMAVGVAFSKRPIQAADQEPAKPEVVLVTEYKQVEKIVVPETKLQVDAEAIVKRIVPEGLANMELEEPSDGVVYGAEVKLVPDASAYSQSYVIKHPRVASILASAHDYYTRGDMGQAVILLDEASVIDPAEPAVIDMKARIFEDMGAYSRAEEFYLKNFQFGLSIGRFYRRAAYKLKNGVGRRFEDGGVLMLGALHMDRDPSGRSATVTIPVRAKPGETIVPDSVEMRVHLYDRVNDEKIEPAARNASIQHSWLGTNVDWQDDQEETARVVYNIASVDEVQQHLYGARKYHGQVVELYYRGELQDLVAFPRTLHQIHAKYTMKPEPNLPPLDLIENFNESNPLLPELPQDNDLGLPR